MKILERLNLSSLGPSLPNLQLGDSVKVVIYLELPTESEGQTKKEKIQSFDGVIIAKHNKNNQIGSTITVRKMFQGGGIEKVFILNSPWIKEITIISRAKVKRAKLYYIRSRTGKSARLKRKV